MTSKGSGAARGYNGGWHALRRVVRDIRERFRGDGVSETANTADSCRWISDGTQCGESVAATIGVTREDASTPQTTFHVCEEHLRDVEGDPNTSIWYINR